MLCSVVNAVQYCAALSGATNIERERLGRKYSPWVSKADSLQLRIKAGVELPPPSF